MLKYTLRRLAAVIPKLIAITVICFVMMELMPGDAFTRSVSYDVLEEMSDYEIAMRRAEMGLDKPAVYRYFKWLFDICRGDLGNSIVDGLPVADKLAVALPYTMELSFYALILSAVLGLSAGFLSAIFKNTVLDYTFNTISVFGHAMPEFFYAMGFVVIFSLKLGWLPEGLRVPPGTMDPTFWDRLPHLVLPVSAMTYALFSGGQRYTRTSMLDVLNKDYIKTARSKGLNEFTVNVKHAFRNATTPVMTMLVMRLPQLVGGSFVIEQVFSYPALGTLSLGATKAGDVAMALIGTCMSGAMMLIASTLVDLFAAMLDPRVRFD